MENNWFKDLFIDEAKAALASRGGGGGGAKFTSGSFKLSENVKTLNYYAATNYFIEHNLGEIPDLFVLTKAYDHMSVTANHAIGEFIYVKSPDSTDGQGYGVSVEGWTGSGETTNTGKVRTQPLGAYNVKQTKSISTTRIAIFGSTADAVISKEYTYNWYAIKF